MSAALGVDRLPPPPRFEPENSSPVSRDAPSEFDDYVLIDEVARGGMGVVYRARQKSLNRIVALKMIGDSFCRDPEAVSRFRSEAEAAAALQHPRIVSIFQIGEREGRPFFSMELVDGVPLSELAREKPPSPHEAAHLVAQIAEAVQYAHEQGVIHRDLKPSNVLIDRAGQPRITDFGLAKRLDIDSEMTGTGQVLGTPGYLPPEQALLRRDLIGPASDVYALGAILYELLTGRPPFRGESALITIRQVLDNEPVSPRRLNPAVSRDLETICLKCLEKDPHRRYPAARELADELGRVARGEPIRARPVRLLSRGWRWCRRNPALAVALSLLLLLAIGGPAVAIYTSGLLQRTQTAEDDRLAARILSLRTAAPEAVGSIVDDLRRDWGAVEPQLLELWEDSSLTDRERTRVSVALLAPDSPQVDYAYARLLETDAREFDMLRSMLEPYREAFVEKLWAVMGPEDTSAARLNAAAALASYAPVDERWSAQAARVATQLVSQNSLTAAAWSGYFEPIKSHLIPHLSEVFRNTAANRAAQRTLATDLLGKYAADDPLLLADLLTTADARQFDVLLTPLQAHGDAARDLLGQRLASCLALKPAGENDAREQSAANLAIALLRLGESDRMWPLLRHTPDPTLRTRLIDRLMPYGADPVLVVHRLETEADVSIRRALILALGEADATTFSAVLRRRSVSHLEDLWRGDPDTGIHSAAEWTLRRWGEDGRLRGSNTTFSRDPKSPPGRYVTSQRQVMTVVHGPVEFRSGGKTIRIERSFAFATKELTREQYLRFESDPQIQAMLAAERAATNNPGRHWYNESWAQSFGPEPQCPHLSIPWRVAVLYCRWLSEQDGLAEEEQCFVPGPLAEDSVELRENYLDRTGYRMPTLAEWEYMCRAGADTERHFGRCVDLLGDYAWYVPNSQQRTWPVGSLKPNDLGVFDIHGNIREWCLNRRGHRLQPGADGVVLDKEEADRSIHPRQNMLTCGGCYNDHARFIRASSRETGHEASVGNNLNGLRLVRTLRTE